MTTLENFYFGNINPSEYRQSKDTKKKLSEMTKLIDELRSMLTTEQQKEELERIENCQLSLIALSEKDAFIEVCPLRKNRQKTYAKNRMKRMTNII